MLAGITEAVCEQAEWLFTSSVVWTLRHNRPNTTCGVYSPPALCRVHSRVVSVQEPYSVSADDAACGGDTVASKHCDSVSGHYKVRVFTLLVPTPQPLAYCTTSQSSGLPLPKSYVSSANLPTFHDGGKPRLGSAWPQYGMCPGTLPHELPSFNVNASHRGIVAGISTAWREGQQLLVLQTTCEKRGQAWVKWSNKCNACVIGDLLADFVSLAGEVVATVPTTTWAVRAEYPTATMPISMPLPSHLAWAPRLHIRLRSAPDAVVPGIAFEVHSCLLRQRQQHDVVACTTPLYGRPNVPRMQEWLRHMRIAGVDHVYVYDRTPDRRFLPGLEPFLRAGSASYEWFPPTQQEFCALHGKLPGALHGADGYIAYRPYVQVKALQHCVHQHRSEASWLIHLDVDE